MSHTIPKDDKHIQYKRHKYESHTIRAVYFNHYLQEKPSKKQTNTHIHYKYNMGSYASVLGDNIKQDIDRRKKTNDGNNAAAATTSFSHLKQSEIKRERSNLHDQVRLSWAPKQMEVRESVCEQPQFDYYETGLPDTRESFSCPVANYYDGKN